MACLVKTISNPAKFNDVEPIRTSFMLLYAART